jgi:Na+/H+-dicarboxylate symporter
MTNHVAIAIGLLAGLFFGLAAAVTGSQALLAVAEGVAPIGTAFVNAVRMVVIPLVATTLFEGVATLGNPRRLGRLGGAALAFFWSTTILGIAFGMAVMRLALPFSPASIEPPLAEETQRALPGAVDFLVNLIPSNPFEAAANADLLPLIVFVMLFAAAAGALPEQHKERLIAFAQAITATLIKLVHWILWTAPLGVFALAAPVTARSGLAMLQSLVVFVVTVVAALVVFIAVVYLPAVRFIGGISPVRFLKACLGSQAIGASTTSSVASLPAMLEAADRDLDVSRPVAILVLSVGASLNRAGSALFQGAGIVFLASLYDVSIPATAVAGAIMVTFFVALTVTGVPSSSVVTLAPALETLGVPLAGMAVLLGVDRVPDMARTATNVTGHLATATVIERLLHRREPRDG